MAKSTHIVIIGGGAAGFFTAINLARLQPTWRVEILEKTSKLLSKVKISGGGRCNVTHHCFDPKQLATHYPRGEKKLRAVFQQFQPQDTIQWFKKRGVTIKNEADNRMFPDTDNSQTIIDCFLKEADRYGVQINTKCGVKSLHQKEDDSWEIALENGKSKVADKVIIATGSQPSAWRMLHALGLKMVEQVPSLFTFNCKDHRLKALQGLSFPNAQVKVAGTKLIAEGPLLITHWGLSGPAILKLSAWGARILNEKKYEFDIMISFSNRNQEAIRTLLKEAKETQGKKLVSNLSVDGIPKRYWQRLCEIAQIPPQQIMGELPKKLFNKLVEELSQGLFTIRGKSTFKDEFVTAGGVDLSEIDFKTMQARRFPNLHFSGEVLDIDAITGGFNFQACWSTAWLLAHAVAEQPVKNSMNS